MLTRLIFVSLLLLNPTLSYATDKMAYRIGIEDIDYYPHFAFGYKKSSFAKELLERFFQSVNADVTYVSLPLKRFNLWYASDKLDFKYPDNRGWRQDEPEKLPIIYSDEIVQLTAGTTVLVDKLGKKRDNIQRLSTILGFYPTLWVDRVKSKQTIIVSDPSVMSVIKMNINGFVDATNLDYSVIHHQLQKLGKTKVMLMDKSLPHMTYGFHLSTIKHPQMIKQFNRFYKNNPLFIQQLKTKYQIIDDPFDLNSF
ncbi:MAG: polar amino acid transport system substrate-binding protein [Phenylobacterium sp.]|jgi:polar amino acid transport system substrate-binding protein